MRREGYEFAVSRPEVIFGRADGAAGADGKGLYRGGLDYLGAVKEMMAGAAA